MYVSDIKYWVTCVGLLVVGGFEVTLAGADVFVVWLELILASELELRAGDNKHDHHYVSVVWLMIYTTYFMSIIRIIKVTTF